MFVSNPFAPTFGASPPILAGRDDILNDIADALATGPTHPHYTTMFLGVRGVGKTVMLNAVEDIARSRGWLTISVNASPDGLIARLFESAMKLFIEFHQVTPKRRIKSVALGGFSIEFADDAESIKPPFIGSRWAISEHAASIGTVTITSNDLRSILSELGQVLADKSVGLVITIDEMQSGDLSEMREFGSVLQHVTRREQHSVAFIGAALPQIEQTLLSDESATFLQRCSRYDIKHLTPASVRSAISEPISQNGKTIDSEALDRAVQAASGYAFMVQLIGFHSWQASGASSHISIEDMKVGIDEAQQRVGRLVLAPTWMALSDVDQRFLMAMAKDEGESQLADIANRMNVSINYAGVYRRRLIQSGMVIAVGKGRIDLAHHTARDWIRHQSSQYTITKSRAHP